MRNRAKCKLCNDIIESKHEHDYVTCKCGEISVDGGTEYYKCLFKKHENFLRVDDEGNEIIIKYEDKSKEPNLKPLDIEKKLNRNDLLDMLSLMVEDIEKLPPHAMFAPVNHSDFAALILLLSSILRCKDDN